MSFYPVGAVTLSLTLVTTLFGNILVLFLLYKPERRLLKRPLYIFIVNICVADIAVVVFSMSFKVIDEIGEDWLFGSAMCKIVEFSQRALFRVNVLSHLFIASDRYYSVVFPLQPQMTRKKAKRMIQASWTFSLLFSIPFVFEFDAETKEDVRICKLVGLPWLWLEKLHTAIDLFLCFLVPLGILLWIYGRIIWSLNLRKRQSTDIGSMNATLNTIRASIRGVRVSVIVVIVFVICWIPVIAKGFSRLKKHGVHTNRTDPLYATAMYFAFFNVELVPLLYCGLDSNLQPAAKRLFRCFPVEESEGSSDEEGARN